MQRSILATTAVLVAFALVLAGCGVGGGTPESKISDTTDNYLRALSSGDTTKACAQLTPKARERSAALADLPWRGSPAE